MTRRLSTVALGRVTRGLSTVALIALGRVLLGCGGEDPTQEPAGCSPANSPLLCGAPLLIAHRGGAKLIKTYRMFDSVAKEN